MIFSSDIKAEPEEEFFKIMQKLYSSPYYGRGHNLLVSGLAIFFSVQ